MLTSQPYATTSPGTESLAGFGIRFIAHIIDMVLLDIVGVAVVLLAAPSLQHNRQALVLLGFALGAVYLLPAYAAGRTLGGLMTGLRIIAAETGGRPGLSRAFARFVVTAALGVCASAAYSLPTLAGAAVALAFSAAIIADYLLMLFNERRQTWHDQLAGTLVVRD